MSEQSPVSMTVVEWELYDQVRHRGLGGNYLLLLTAFGNAPFYSGQAKVFTPRFGTHTRLFGTGMRTFLRQPFLGLPVERSHAGFAARWDGYRKLDSDEQKKLVWVPEKLPNETMGPEGAIFRANEILVLVSAGRTDKDARSAVERRVQADIISYYNGLHGQPIDWSVPRTKSILVGQRGKVDTDPSLEHRFEDGRQMGVNEFFSQLEQWRR